MPQPRAVYLVILVQHPDDWVGVLLCTLYCSMLVMFAASHRSQELRSALPGQRNAVSTKYFRKKGCGDKDSQKKQNIENKSTERVRGNETQREMEKCDLPKGTIGVSCDGDNVGVCSGTRILQGS